jgi:hypothetical protein
MNDAMNTASFSIEAIRARAAARAAKRAERAYTQCVCFDCANARRTKVRFVETYMVGSVCKRRIHLTIKR